MHLWLVHRTSTAQLLPSAARIADRYGHRGHATEKVYGYCKATSHCWVNVERLRKYVPLPCQSMCAAQSQYCVNTDSLRTKSSCSRISTAVLYALRWRWPCCCLVVNPTLAALYLCLPSLMAPSKREALHRPWLPAVLKPAVSRRILACWLGSCAAPQSLAALRLHLQLLIHRHCLLRRLVGEPCPRMSARWFTT